MTMWEVILAGLWLGGFPLIFLFVSFPLIRLSLWLTDRIRGKLDPLETFRPWRAWLAWPIFLTLVMWSIGLGAAACLGYVYLTATVTQ